MNRQPTPAQETAINAIVALNTLPPQIDCIPCNMRQAGNRAEAYLATLPATQQGECYAEIESRVDAYYEPSIKGADGNFYSVASLDAMF